MTGTGTGTGAGDVHTALEGRGFAVYEFCAAPNKEPAPGAARLLWLRHKGGSVSVHVDWSAPPGRNLAAAREAVREALDELGATYDSPFADVFRVRARAAANDDEGEGGEDGGNDEENGDEDYDDDCDE